MLQSSAPPLRSHFALYAVGALLVGFFAWEIAIGASLLFALLLTGALTFVALTVQTVGGLGTLHGMCLVALTCQHFFVAQIVKGVMGQAPETRLDRPIETAAAYLIACFSYYIGAVLSNRFRFRGGKPLFRPTVDPDLLARMAVSAAVLALVRTALSFGGQSEDNFSTGGIMGVIRQLYVLDYLAVSCATASIVLASNQTKLFSRLTFFTLAGPLALGLVGGHRAAILGPFSVIFLTAWAFGFKFRPKHLALVGVVGYVFFAIISPFGLAIRSAGRTGNVLKDAQIATNILGDIILRKSDPLSEKPQIDVTPTVFATRYFGIQKNTTSNVFERLALMKAADALVNVTLNEGTSDWTTITHGFLQLLPSFVFPDKPIFATGNMLAHRVPGWVYEKDFSTQITFGVVGDSFSSFAWLGVLLIPGIIIFCARLVIGWVMSLNYRFNVFAIAITFRYAIIFSEASIQSNTVFVFQTTLAIIFAFYATGQLAKLGDFGYLRPRPLPKPNL